MNSNKIDTLSVSVFTAKPNWGCSDYIRTIKKMYLLEQKRYLWYFQKYYTVRLSASNFYEMAYVAKNYMLNGKTAFVVETMVEYSQLQHYMLYAKEMNESHDV